ncbi:MAG TPA: hypothetical protein VFQ48_07460, partial [Pseudonocardiaceae bacterium]|nr:hypothetical protein [Pseudonocardiaceae bacterium]
GLRVPPLNLRMGELEGALGLVQLGRVDGIIATLRRSHAALTVTLTAAGVETRPVPAGATEVGSSVLFYLGDRAEARWVAHALIAEGVRAGLLIGDAAGTNRHWAGHWDIALTRTGVPLPTPEQVEHDRAVLDAAVHIPVDLGWSDRDVEETCAALDKVLGHRDPPRDA